MNPEPMPENEKKVGKSTESLESEINQAAQMLESPPKDDFVEGLKGFIAWVKSLVAKSD